MNVLCKFNVHNYVLAHDMNLKLLLCTLLSMGTCEAVLVVKVHRFLPRRCGCIKSQHTKW